MKEKVAVFTEKCECSDLFTIAENKYRTEASLYKDKKIVQEAGLEPARYCYHRHLKPARLPIPPLPRTAFRIISFLSANVNRKIDKIETLFHF